LTPIERRNAIKQLVFLLLQRMILITTLPWLKCSMLRKSSNPLRKVSFFNKLNLHQKKPERIEALLMMMTYYLTADGL